jgi:hypothetical protein
VIAAHGLPERLAGTVLNVFMSGLLRSTFARIVNTRDPPRLA